jgi:nucleoside-diphosphate-sugar epimerase
LRAPCADRWFGSWHTDGRFALFQPTWPRQDPNSPYSGVIAIFADK